jgi:hypothetical protein
VEISETRYAQSRDVNIAYRIAGDGPFDVVWIRPGISNVERAFDAGGVQREFFERIASFCRLIVSTSGAPACQTAWRGSRTSRRAWTTSVR